MMKRYTVVLVVAVAGGLALVGAIPSLAAAEACYRVQIRGTGNYSDENCTRRVPLLTGEYVLGTLKHRIAGNLWCLELLEEVGTHEDELCSRLLAHGRFIEVLPASKSTSVLLLSGESFPVSVNGSSTEATELQNAAGTLKGREASSTGEILKETGGLYKAEFKNVEEPVSRAKCNSSGDGAGVVLTLQANFFAVHDEDELRGAGILFEVPEFSITCGTTTVKIKGNQVGLVTNPNRSGEDLLTSFKLKLHCSSTVGEPEDTQYWTSLLASKLTPVLLANFGTGFKKACELVSGETTVNLGKMIEMMNP